MRQDVLTKTIFDKVVKSSSGFIQDYRADKILTVARYESVIDGTKVRPAMSIKCIDGSGFYSAIPSVTVDIPYVLTEYSNKREVMNRSKKGIALDSHSRFCKNTIEVEVNNIKIPDANIRLVCCHNGSTILIPRVINNGQQVIYDMTNTNNKIRITVKRYRRDVYLNACVRLEANGNGGNFDTGINFDTIGLPPAYLRIYKNGKLLPPCMMSDETPYYANHMFTVHSNGNLIYNYTGQLHVPTLFEVIDDYSISGIYNCDASDGKIIIPRGILNEDITVISESQVRVYEGADNEYSSVDYDGIDRISHRILEVLNPVAPIRDYLIRVYDNVELGNALVGSYSDDIYNYMKFFYDDSLRQHIFAPEIGDFTLASIVDYYDNLLDHPIGLDSIDDVSHDNRVDFMKSLVKTNSNNFKNLLANYSDHGDRFYTEDVAIIDKLVKDDGHLLLSLRDTPDVDDTVMIMINGIKIGQDKSIIVEGELGVISVDCDISDIPKDTINRIELYIQNGMQNIPRIKTSVEADNTFIFNQYDLSWHDDDQWVIYLRSETPSPRLDLNDGSLAYTYLLMTEDIEYTKESTGDGKWKISLLESTGAKEGSGILIMNTRFKYSFAYTSNDPISSLRGKRRLEVYDPDSNEMLPIPIDERYRVDVYSAGRHYLSGIAMFVVPQGSPESRDIAEIIFTHIPSIGDRVEIYFSGIANRTYTTIEYLGEENEMGIIRCSDLPIPFDDRYMTVVIDGVRIPREWVLPLSDKTLKIWNAVLPFREFGIITDFKEHGISEFQTMIDAYNDGANILDKSIANHASRYDYNNTVAVDPVYKTLIDILDNSPFADGEWALRNPIDPDADNEFTLSPFLNKFLDNVYLDKESKELNANKFTMLDFDEYAVYIPKSEYTNGIIRLDANKIGIVATRMVLDANAGGKTPDEVKVSMLSMTISNAMKLDTKEIPVGDLITRSLDANIPFTTVFKDGKFIRQIHAFECPHNEGIIDANIVYPEDIVPSLDCNNIMKIIKL